MKKMHKKTDVLGLTPYASRLTPHDSRGFTLIETVMVIALLGIVGAGILLYFSGMRGSADPVLRIQAIELAQEKMERIIADKKANGFNSIVAEAAAALAAPFTNFTREVTVICVTEGALNTDIGGMPNCGAPGSYRAKNVKVTVTWTGGGSTGVSLVTVLSDR